MSGRGTSGLSAEQEDEFEDDINEHIKSARRALDDLQLLVHRLGSPHYHGDDEYGQRSHVAHALDLIDAADAAVAHLQWQCITALIHPDGYPQPTDFMIGTRRFK